MLADGEVAAGPIADFITVGVPIIPEVTRIGKGLIFVIEIDLIEPAIEATPPTPAFWSATSLAGDIGTNWDTYMADEFVSVDTIISGSIVAAPDSSPALQANFQVAALHGSSDVCEQLVSLATVLRAAVTLRYEVYLDPGVDYLAVADLGGSQTIAYLTFPGLVGGLLWPGPNGRAYPVGSEAVDEGWSARLRVAGSGAIGPYLYVQNKPGAFGWHRLSSHPLRINDLRGSWSIWEQTCIMNTLGAADGRCLLQINGATIVDVSDIEYRPASAPSWVNNGMRHEISLTDTTPADQIFNIWFKNFEMRAATSLPPPQSLQRLKYGNDIVTYGADHVAY